MSINNTSEHTHHNLLEGLSKLQIDEEQVIKMALDIIDSKTDETDIKRKEHEMEKLSDRYKTIFENSIIGLSFYSPEGWLLNSNRIMREICHFDGEDSDSFYSKANLFEMSPFSEVLSREHPEEYWACSLSIVPEKNMYVYLEISVHPIYDDHGKLTYIAVSAHDVTEEREMYLQVKENDIELQKVNASIQNYEAELRYMMQACQMQAFRVSFERDTLELFSGLNTVTHTLSLKKLQQLFVKQDDDFVKSLSNLPEVLSKPIAEICLMYPVVTQDTAGPQWVQINTIPERDSKGRQLGVFGIWRNVNDIMRKQEQLRQETERANESGHLKSVFLANMTHEIRTPLNAIVGFSDVLSMLSTKEEKQEMVQVIMNNCDMLLRLVNDILVASSLDTGGVQLLPVKTDLAKAFDEWCKSLQARVDNPSVQFIKENPCDSFVATIDVDRINQVLTNFVTNAVKYTNEGHIKVGWKPMNSDELASDLRPQASADGLYFYCEDTGAGIPLEAQDKIFERFFKLNDYIQGTGLGLAISKAIADAYQGSIGVKSAGVGQGSTFWMWIPLGKGKNEKE